MIPLFFLHMGSEPHQVETLVQAVQSGEDSAIEPLWRSVQMFIRSCARSFAQKLPPERGVDADDLEQSGYFALLDAVRTYDPERGMSFIGWLGIRLHPYFQECAGYRQRREPLNFSESLDAPICPDDPDSPTGGDLLPDDHAEDAFTTVVDRIWNEQLHDALDDALDDLKPREAAIIRQRYFSGKRQREIADELGIRTVSQVSSLEQHGLFYLRWKSSKASRLQSFLEDATDYYRGGFRPTETIVEHRENLARQFLGGAGITHKTPSVGITESLRRKASSE